MNLASLIARVDAAKGPNRSLDADLAAFLNLPTDLRKHRGYKVIVCYSRSVEHAAWVINQALPKWDWSVHSPNEKGIYSTILWAPCGSDFEGYARTPALSMLSAVLAVYKEGFAPSQEAKR